MTWRRLESSHVDPQLTAGMAARIADPLWALARQWQVGEFRGEDAARPALIEAVVSTLPMTGAGPYERGQHGTPLETLVEMEPVRDGAAALRLSADAGAALARRLRRMLGRDAQPIVQQLREQFPLKVPEDERTTLDPRGTALLAALVRTSFDGHRLLGALRRRGVGEVAKRFGLDDPEPLAAWAADEEALFDEPDGASPMWQPRKLSYDATVRVEGGIELQAEEYRGGRLDWFQFDAAKLDDDGAGEAAATEELRVLPVPLRYDGQPANRFWEFEDQPVALTTLDGGPEDFARSVVANFAAIGGEDWFVVPARLPVGTVARIVKLRVLDDFGTWHVIEATAVLDGPERVWRFFEHTGDWGPQKGRAPLLSIMPVVDDGERGRVLEQVDVRRDESANLAWAIERIVESHAGTSIDRRAAAARTATEDEPARDGWWFELTTSVPDHWFPLVPQRIAEDSAATVLRRGTVADATGTPLGEVLLPDQPFVLHEEEIPPGGVRVTRRFQYSRSPDGTPHLWMARRVGPATGDIEDSPLAFDRLHRDDPTPPEEPPAS